MKSKLLYGLLLSSMFIYIDAKNKIFSVSTNDENQQTTITNSKTNDSTTITSGVSPTYSRSTTRPKIKAQAQANTTTTTTYISEPVNQTFTEKIHTNPAGGSTTLSNWNNINSITHTNLAGGATYATKNSVEHMNKTGGSTNVYGYGDNHSVTHTHSKITDANPIGSSEGSTYVAINEDGNISGVQHTNIAGGLTGVVNDGSGIQGVHYTSQSVAIPIGGATTTTISTQTDTASNPS